MACWSAAVYTAITRSAGRPSEFHSRTALTSRIAGSPRLTIARRWKEGRGPWMLIRSLAEGNAHVVCRRSGHPRCRCGSAADVLQDIQHHLVGDDGRIDAHHRVTPDGARSEAGREDPGRA